MHEQKTVETRFFIKCKKCNYRGTVEGTKTITRYSYYQRTKTDITWNIDRNNHACPNCNTSEYLEIKALKGTKVTNIACGPKCYNAVGPNCDCECGGKNHGLGHPWHVEYREETIFNGRDKK